MNSSANKIKSLILPRTLMRLAGRLKDPTSLRKASRRRSRVSLKEKSGKKRSIKTGSSLAVEIKCSQM